MYKQNAYLVKHSDLGAKNLNKICFSIVQKVLKWPLQYEIFKKFPGEQAPGLHYSLFLFPICFKIILPKKARLKIWQIWVPLF